LHASIQQRREAATQRTSGHVIGAVGCGLQPGPLYQRHKPETLFGDI